RLINPSFEQYEGDLLLEGPDQIRVTGWTFSKYREVDKISRFSLVRMPVHGEFAGAILASGEAPVSIRQNLPLTSPGRYQARAWIRTVHSTDAPVIRIHLWNPASGTLVAPGATFSPDTQFREYRFDFHIAELPAQPPEFVISVTSGKGDILIDQVSVQKIDP
ncbi:MAG: hypothetical protein U1E27_13545, partial [Kiritimatiellia bacterium]|nr:hypothetical protein [Kiritimatiellia bacterium]